MVYVLLGNGFEELETIAPVDILRRGGVEAQMGRRDTEEEILVTISIPKRGKKAGP